METFWDNKRIRLLLTADTDTVEAFLSQFAPVIYTWLFYQIGADSKIATELTARTFSQAIKNLPDFDPACLTFLQWLKEQSIQSRDQGLEQLQIKPQRPWAWSQLPDEVLCGLSRFRCELLDDAILSNTFLHEIVQATLSEIDYRDRELLIYRFCHLDNEENIADEMDCRIEDVQNWLYRSRHSFRRTFFQLIASSNSGFSESSDTGDIKIQDSNFEKLLSTTRPCQVMDDAQMDIIRSHIRDAIKESAQSLPEKKSKSGLLAIIGCAIAVILIAGIFLILRDTETISPPPVNDANKPQQASSEEPEQSENRKLTQKDIDEAELRRVFALGQAGDVDALLEVLKSGQFVSQRVAAPFLGKLADPSAIDLLRQAAELWYPESPEDNPFAEAIEQILIRFPDAALPVTTVIEENVESEPNIAPEVPKEPNQLPVVTPNITGTIVDFLNQPIPNTSVELTQKQLFSNTGQTIESTKANELGQYQFDKVVNKGASLTCRIPEGSVKAITKSLWGGNDSSRIVNFGGRPALTGAAIIDGNPLSAQTLYLSDTLDIADAAFLEEVVTDSQGNFSLLGVMPGVYSVLYRGLDNSIRRLASIEMPQQDVFNINMDIETVTLWADGLSGSEQAGVSRAVLVYGLGLSDSLSQMQGDFSDDGRIFFENVIPGSYVLRAQLENGIWLQQEVQIETGILEQTAQMQPVPEETSVLYGQFLYATPMDLFLTTMDQNVHMDVIPDSSGNYEITDIPSDIYSLAGFVKGQLIRFSEIDLQAEPEMTLDIDPAAMMGTYSPLYVMVTDASGIVLSGAQVWLTGTGTGSVFTVSSTGQGAFLEAIPGNYTLSVAHPKYPTVNREIILNSSTLLAEPNSENTILIQLGTQPK